MLDTLRAVASTGACLVNGNHLRRTDERGNMGCFRPRDPISFERELLGPLIRTQVGETSKNHYGFCSP